MRQIWNKIAYYLFRMQKYEDKLRIYEGYRENSIIDWKIKTEFSWRLMRKILQNLTIFSTSQIREVLRKQYENNKELFEDKNTYFTSFGEAGKSGDLMLYQLRHSIDRIGKRVKEPWEITNLPTGSNIIFIDDLIGTGKQSTTYINEKLNLVIKPSFNCFILCLCGTEAGINKVEEETNFKVICDLVLSKSKNEFLSNDCEIFSQTEKDIISQKNNLISSNSDEYNKGLLVAFAHCVPNNTMPIIWKDNYKFKIKDETSYWRAILPRKF